MTKFSPEAEHHSFSLFSPTVPKDVDSVQRNKRVLGPDNHALFRFADPDSRIVELLVWLVRTLGISNLKKGRVIEMSTQQNYWPNVNSVS